MKAAGEENDGQDWKEEDHGKGDNACGISDNFYGKRQQSSSSLESLCLMNRSGTLPLQEVKDEVKKEHDAEDEGRHELEIHW